MFYKRNISLKYFFKGQILTESEKSILYEDILTKFLDFASIIPPCCKRVMKFWQHVFLLNPKSDFKWSFEK